MPSVTPRLLALAALCLVACEPADDACTPGALSCSALNNRLERCGDDGKTKELVRTCPGNTCEVVDGVATCDEPTLECEPNARRCSTTDPRVIEQCRTDGAAWFAQAPCAGGTCQPVGTTVQCVEDEPPPLCTPNTTQCSPLNNRVEQCNAEGTALTTLATCPGNSCKIIGGVAQCEICVPNTTTCGANNDTVEVCNAEGTAFTTLDTCALQSCKPVGDTHACELPCTPGETRCNAQRSRVEVCDPTGLSFSPTDTCLNNSCTTTAPGSPGVAICTTPQVCTPNTRRCSTSAPKVVEQCRTDGTGWFAQAPCAGILACTTATGSAQCQSCVPGDRQCGANNASLTVCNTDGTRYETVQSCTNNSCKLIDGERACEFPCAPGTTRCSALRNFLQVCDASGTSYTNLETCGGNSCQIGANGPFCQNATACTANSRRCSADNPKVVQQCRTDGAGWFDQAPCPGALECSLATGSAQCQTCVPGTRICGANNGTVQVCNTAGTAWETLQTCADNSCKTTTTGALCELPCVAGTTRCNALRSRVEVCAPGGAFYVAAETCLSNSCTTDTDGAFCQTPQVCTPNTRRCSTSDPRVVEQCRTDGAGWFAQAPCANNLQCTTALGSAQCQTCVPSSLLCGANNASLLQCNAAGTAYSTLEQCQSNSCKLLGATLDCEFPCMPGETRCNALRSAVHRCDASGLTTSPIETCVNNSCTTGALGPFCQTPQACTPNSRRCSPSNPQLVEQCNSAGSAWTTATTCQGQLQCGTATGTAACQSCVPDTLRCASNNTRLERCSADGSAFLLEDTCANGSCKLLGQTLACEYPCTPGSTRCNGLKTQVEVCDAAGLTHSRLDTCLANSCTGESDFAYCGQPRVCTPNTTRCSDTNPHVVEVCNTDGSAWRSQTTCTSGLLCVATTSQSGTGATCQSCVPGTRTCGANNGSVLVCNTLGTAWETEASCLGSTLQVEQRDHRLRAPLHARFPPLQRTEKLRTRMPRRWRRLGQYRHLRPELVHREPLGCELRAATAPLRARLDPLQHARHPGPDL